MTVHHELQGATLAEPDVNLSAHPAPIIQPPGQFPFPNEQTLSEKPRPGDLAHEMLWCDVAPNACACASTTWTGSHSCFAIEVSSPIDGIDRSSSPSLEAPD